MVFIQSRYFTKQLWLKSCVDPREGGTARLVASLKLNIQTFDENLFFILRFILPSQSFITLFFLFPFLSLNILIVYLRLKGLVSLFAFIHYVNILLFHWIYFMSFFGYYIEQNIISALFIQRQSLGDFLQNSCSTSVLNQLKHVCQTVLFSLNLQAVNTLTQAFYCKLCELFKNIFSIEPLGTLASVFLQSTFFKGCFQRNC